MTASPSPLPYGAQPPPPIPNMPDVSNTLTNYLNIFALWCRRGFAAKLDNSVALPGILLQANDTAPGAIPKVFMLQVDSVGTIAIVPVSLGGGKP